MNVLVTTGYHFLRDKGGTYWTENGSVAYAFWQRYLDVFDGVRVVARAAACDRVPDDWQQVTGPGVEVRPIPDFRSPVDLVRHWRTSAEVVRQTTSEAPAAIVRIPCLVGGIASQTLHAMGRPFAAEVLGDPYDSFAPGAFRGRFRPFYRWWFTRQLKRQCRQAEAASYVTQQALQRRYPVREGAYTTNYSSIVLPAESLATQPRRYDTVPRPIRLVMVGTLATLYKAPHILIDAVACCVQKGLPLEMTFVGGGKHLPDMQQRARRAGVSDEVRFLGQLPSAAAVREELDRADLFVLPSFQEGLPRAMIEAMARALPCIGSTAGGIPELLPAEDMVPPGDATALAEKIYEFATDAPRLTRCSARNLETARQYEEQTLRQRRVAFYENIRDRTAQWLKQHAAAPC